MFFYVDIDINTDDLECPGYYRCNREKNCVSQSQVCDGVKDCFHGDDELFCGKNKHVML